MLTRTLKTLVLTLVSVLLFTLSLPGDASAQTEADKATARALSIEAQKALEAKNYEEAADKFGRAEKLYHAPTLLVGLGRAYVGLGKYVEAMESYNEVIREKLPANASDAFKKAKEDAKKEIEGLESKIAWVTLRVEGPDEPQVELDGSNVPVASLGVRRAVNPGEHRLTAFAEGWRPGEQAFSIDPGGEQEVVLTLEEAPPGEVTTALSPTTGPTTGTGDTGVTPEGGSDTLTILGWTAVGLGGAGIIVGAITGGLAIGKRGELTDACDESGQCPPEQQSTLDSYRTMGTVSTVGFIAGGVLAAAGTVLLIVAPSDDVEAEIGLGRVGLRVRF